MRDALILTVMGMGVVYLVLALIYGAIVGLGFMDRIWPQTAAAAAKEPASSAATPVSTRSLQPEEEAAIVAALAKHTNRSPDSFSIRIGSDK